MRIGFARRGFERPEVTAVDLVALHQADVRELGRCGFHGVDHVGQHGEVGRHQFSPGRAVLIGGVEEVRDVAKCAELDARVGCVEQVDGHMPDALRRFPAAARQADDAPVVQCGEVLDQVAADHALCAHDERDFILCSHVGVELSPKQQWQWPPV